MRVRKVLVALGIFAAIQLVAYVGFFRGQLEDIDRTREGIDRSKLDYAYKKNQAVNLDLYKQQYRDLDELFGLMLEALPSRYHMPFEDVINAAKANGLSIELKIANAVLLRDSYAELDARLDVRGQFHQVGAFVADVMHLPASATLSSFILERTTTPGVVSMTGVARIFRYVDEEEMASHRGAAPTEKKKAK